MIDLLVTRTPVLAPAGGHFRLKLKLIEVHTAHHLTCVCDLLPNKVISYLSIA